jgi:hypothetical protein
MMQGQANIEFLKYVDGFRNAPTQLILIILQSAEDTLSNTEHHRRLCDLKLEVFKAVINRNT